MHAPCPQPHTCAELFLSADTDGSGFLDRNEFAAVLKGAHLHLSDRCAEGRRVRGGRRLHFMF